jgi:hypothetical protein
MNNAGRPFESRRVRRFGTVTAVMPARPGEAARVRRPIPAAIHCPTRPAVDAGPVGRHSKRRAFRAVIPGRWPPGASDLGELPWIPLTIRPITSVRLHPTIICSSSAGGLLRRSEAGATTTSHTQDQEHRAAMTGSHSRTRPPRCFTTRKARPAGIYARGQRASRRTRLATEGFQEGRNAGHRS